MALEVAGSIEAAIILVTDEDPQVRAEFEKQLQLRAIEEKARVPAGVVVSANGAAQSWVAAAGMV